MSAYLSASVSFYATDVLISANWESTHFLCCCCCMCHLIMSHMYSWQWRCKRPNRMLCKCRKVTAILIAKGFCVVAVNKRVPPENPPDSAWGQNTKYTRILKVCTQKSSWIILDNDFKLNKMLFVYIATLRSTTQDDSRLLYWWNHDTRGTSLQMFSWQKFIQIPGCMVCDGICVLCHHPFWYDFDRKINICIYFQWYWKSNCQVF